MSKKKSKEKVDVYKRQPQGIYGENTVAYQGIFRAAILRIAENSPIR